MAGSPAEGTDPRVASPPFRALLARIVWAGVAAGVLSGLWSLLVTERTIAPALAIEEARPATGDGEGLVSRSTQLVGGLLGVALAGVLVSLLFAAVFAAVRHRLPARTDLGRAVVLAAVGFGVFALLPAIALPANPPAVGDPATVGTRTALYGSVLAAGAAVALLVAAAVSVLRSRGWATPATVITATLTGVALVGLVLWFLPGSPDAVPPDVPATVVWDFRLASLGQLAVLWATLGLVGGALVDRLSRRQPAVLG